MIDDDGAHMKQQQVQQPQVLSALLLGLELEVYMNLVLAYSRKVLMGNAVTSNTEHFVLQRCRT